MKTFSALILHLLPGKTISSTATMESSLTWRIDTDFFVMPYHRGGLLIRKSALGGLVANATPGTLFLPLGLLRDRPFVRSSCLVGASNVRTSGILLPAICSAKA